MPEKNVVNKFFTLLNGYRAIHAIIKLKDLRYNRHTLGIKSKSELEIRLETELARQLQCSVKELDELISQLKNAIDYAGWDAAKVYPNSVFEPGVPVLKISHDMPGNILQAYINSMHELVSVSNVDLSCLKPYIANKGVLDFGCGSGSYVQPIASVGPRKVWLYDRPSIISRLGCVPPNFIPIESTEGLSKIGEHIDTVWLSLVLHTKPSIVEFMRDEVLRYAPRSEHIIVNSLREEVGGYSMFFDLQTLAHCGCLWNSRGETIHSMERIGYNPLFSCNTSDFTAATVFVYQGRPKP